MIVRDWGDHTFKGQPICLGSTKDYWAACWGILRAETGLYWEGRWQAVQIVDPGSEDQHPEWLLQAPQGWDAGRRLLVSWIRLAGSLEGIRRKERRCVMTDLSPHELCRNEESANAYSFLGFRNGSLYQNEILFCYWYWVFCIFISFLKLKTSCSAKQLGIPSLSVSCMKCAAENVTKSAVYGKMLHWELFQINWNHSWEDLIKLNIIVGNNDAIYFNPFLKVLHAVGVSLGCVPITAHQCSVELSLLWTEHLNNVTYFKSNRNGYRLHILLIFPSLFVVVWSVYSRYCTVEGWVVFRLGLLFYIWELFIKVRNIEK